MDKTGYYSFNENALPHAKMDQFEPQPNDAARAFSQVSNGSFNANAAFTSEGANKSAIRDNIYSINDYDLPGPIVNHLWNPIPNNHHTMLEGQYAFDHFALSQPAVANPSVLTHQTGVSTSVDQQAFEQTITELSDPNWLTAGPGSNTLRGNVTGLGQPACLTGSDLDAHFEVDESDSELSRPPRSDCKRRCTECRCLCLAEHFIA